MNMSKQEYHKMMSHKMGLDDTFAFHCTACGKCCKHRDDVLLTPYDLFRIARYFRHTPAEIIESYCEPYVGSISHCPVVRIKPVLPENACPFLRNKKCVVHKDKPMVCAVFPLARIMLRSENKPVYVLQPNITCGKKDRTVSVRQWIGHLCNEENERIGAMWGDCAITVAQALMDQWDKFSQEKRSNTFHMLLDLLYMSYDINMPFIPQFEKNVLTALVYLHKLVGLPDIPAWLHIQDLTDNRIQYDFLLLKAYCLYKLDWCAQRGVQLEDVDVQTGIQGGGCYVCLQEFEQAEFQDAGYIQGLLDADDWTLWKRHQEVL